MGALALVCLCMVHREHAADSAQVALFVFFSLSCVDHPCGLCLLPGLLMANAPVQFPTLSNLIEYLLHPSQIVFPATIGPYSR